MEDSNTQDALMELPYLLPLALLQRLCAEADQHISYAETLESKGINFALLYCPKWNTSLPKYRQTFLLPSFQKADSDMLFLIAIQ